MKIENPLAFGFIMQDDIFLLNKDKIERKTQPTPMVLQTEVVTEPGPVNFKYLGDYKKKLLIIGHYTTTDFIDGRHLTALESVLKRLDLSLQDAAVLNRANYPDTTFDELSAFFNPAKLLLLGGKALPAGVGVIALNKPVLINNTKALFSFSFDEMMDNNDNKKAFWEQMKQL